jgi:hypothetical protein
MIDGSFEVSLHLDDFGDYLLYLRLLEVIIEDEVEGQIICVIVLVDVKGQRLIMYSKA